MKELRLRIERFMEDQKQIRRISLHEQAYSMRGTLICS